MGEIVELPAGRARTRRVKRIKAEERAEKKGAPKQRRNWLGAFAAGTKHFALASLRVFAGDFCGLIAGCMRVIRRPINLCLTLGTVSMVVMVFIQAMNNWKEPKLVVLSIAGAVFFLAVGGLYDRVIRALLTLECRFKGETV